MALASALIQGSMPPAAKTAISLSGRRSGVHGLSVPRQVRRQYQFATGNTLIDLDRKRHVSVTLGSVGRLFTGAGSILTALVLGALSRRKFRKHALRAGKKAMYAA